MQMKSVSYLKLTPGVGKKKATSGWHRGVLLDFSMDSDNEGNFPVGIIMHEDNTLAAYPLSSIKVIK